MREAGTRDRIRHLGAAVILMLAQGCAGLGQTAPPETDVAKLVQVRFWSTGEETRVALETSAEVEYRYHRLQNPDRIYFDLLHTEPTRAKGTIEVIPVGDDLLKQIRVALTQPGVTRVVLDLAGPANLAHSQLTNPARLLIQLRPGSPATAGEITTYRAPRAFVPPASFTSAPQIPEERILFGKPPSFEIAALPAGRAPAMVIAPAATPLPPPPAPATRPPQKIAAERRGTVSTSAAIEERVPLPAQRTGSKAESLTRVLGLKLGTVVLDPGHGGSDTGTIGRGGLMEKDLALDIAKRLAALLRERLGSQVVLTRDDDSHVALERRTQIATEHQADLFLSIHANSSPLRSVVGMETFYLNFTTSRDALEVAARENASSERTVHELRDLIRKIALKEKVDESRELAARVQSAGHELAVKTYGRSVRNRGVKRAPFVVLIGADMPSALAEVGFVSNTKEETILKKPEHRQRLAEALYKGIERYSQTLSRFAVARRGVD